MKKYVSLTFFILTLNAFQYMAAMESPSQKLTEQDLKNLIENFNKTIKETLNKYQSIRKKYEELNTQFNNNILTREAYVNSLKSLKNEYEFLITQIRAALSDYSILSVAKTYKNFEQWINKISDSILALLGEIENLSS